MDSVIIPSKVYAIIMLFPARLWAVCLLKYVFMFLVKEKYFLNFEYCARFEWALPRKDAGFKTVLWSTDQSGAVSGEKQGITNKGHADTDASSRTTPHKSLCWLPIKLQAICALQQIILWLTDPLISFQTNMLSFGDMNSVITEALPPLTIASKLKCWPVTYKDMPAGERFAGDVFLHD